VEGSLILINRDLTLDLFTQLCTSHTYGNATYAYDKREISSCNWRDARSARVTLNLRSRDGLVPRDSPGLDTHAEHWRYA